MWLICNQSASLASSADQLDPGCPPGSDLAQMPAPLTGEAVTGVSPRESRPGRLITFHWLLPDPFLPSLPHAEPREAGARASGLWLGLINGRWWQEGRGQVDRVVHEGVRWQASPRRARGVLWKALICSVCPILWCNNIYRSISTTQMCRWVTS